MPTAMNDSGQAVIPSAGVSIPAGKARGGHYQEATGNTGEDLRWRTKEVSFRNINFGKNKQATR